MRRLIGAFFALVLGTMGVTSLATSASAHSADVSGSAVCQADGTYTITWTVKTSNVPSNTEGEVKVIKPVNLWLFEWAEHKANHGLSALKPNASFTWVQTGVAGTKTSATAAFQIDWKDGFSHDPEGTVRLGGNCGPDTSDKKIVVCHATSSDSNPFTKIEVSKASFYEGHRVHEGDIYPAGSFEKGNKTYSWPAQGDQSLLDNEDCASNNAVATVTTTRATCTDQDNGTGTATWTNATLTSVTGPNGSVDPATIPNGSAITAAIGDYTLVFTADAGHRFEGGKKTKTVAVTVGGVKESCYVPPTVVAPDFESSITTPYCSDFKPVPGFVTAQFADAPQYGFTVNGEPVGAGLKKYTEPGDYTVEAVLNAGNYTFGDNQHTWAFTVPEPKSIEDCAAVVKPVASATSECVADEQNKPVDIVLDNSGSEIAVLFKLAFAGNTPAEVQVGAGETKNLHYFVPQGVTYSLVITAGEETLFEGSFTGNCITETPPVVNPQVSVELYCDDQVPAQDDYLTIYVLLDNSGSEIAQTFTTSFDGESFDTEVPAGKIFEGSFILPRGESVHLILSVGDTVLYDKTLTGACAPVVTPTPTPTPTFPEPTPTNPTTPPVPTFTPTPEPTTPTTEPTTPVSHRKVPPQLSQTGGEAQPLILLAGILIVAGAIFISIRRRKNS